MCGITGIWSYNQPDISDVEMDIFTDILSHRGPDGRGTYHDQECNLRLGHRRLAILDLSDAGHQPMSSADGRFWIVYNGEIYNYLELKEELEALGYTFTSHSDTEVLLASYIQWGEECQLRFNGMWAFAIWDTHTRTLFLSRDRFGIKPLYYIVNDRFFSFNSKEPRSVSFKE
jgi:asparagine synthase (glutamine-hydrolysing)